MADINDDDLKGRFIKPPAWTVQPKKARQFTKAGKPVSRFTMHCRFNDITANFKIKKFTYRGDDKLIDLNLKGINVNEFIGQNYPEELKALLYWMAVINTQILDVIIYDNFRVDGAEIYRRVGNKLLSDFLKLYDK